MINRVTVDNLNTQLRTDDAVQLVDVRNQNDYVHCFIRQSKNIPLSSLDKSKVAPDQPVFLICKSGKLCDEAAAKLEGCSDIRIVAGGMIAWETQHFPVCWTYPARYKLLGVSTVVLLSILLAWGTTHLAVPTAMKFALFIIIIVVGRSVIADICTVHNR